MVESLAESWENRAGIVPSIVQILRINRAESRASRADFSSLRVPCWISRIAPPKALDVRSWLAADCNCIVWKPPFASPAISNPTVGYHARGVPTKMWRYF